MDIRNCLKCKQVFTYMSSPYCKKCEREEEKLFETVKTYLGDNPDSTMLEVVEATGVSAKKITRYIKEGRLEISKGMHGILTCEQCNKPITKGKFCDSCVIKLNHEIDTAFAKKHDGARMHSRR